MSYTEYNKLKNPNEVLSAMVDFFKKHDYNVIQDITDDLNIYDRATTDGKKFIVNDKTRDYVLCFRTANGTNIFGSSNDGVMDNKSMEKDAGYYGIGLTISEGYSSVQRWYNQYNVPTKFGVAVNDKDVLGMWLPVPTEVHARSESGETGESTKVETGLTYTLYCNYLSLPSNTVVFTLMRENAYQKQVAHLAFGNVTKYEDWTGGIYMSASANRYMMKEAYKCFGNDPAADKYILPIFGTSSKETNTLVRIDIDDAPNQSRGTVLWASSGLDNITGKKLCTPIRTSLNTNGKVPHYYYMQSKSRFDSGMDVNTLNCIAVNMPLMLAVLVDPDILDLYAPIGLINGVYFISTLNVQTSHLYEMSYPESNNLCQVFPMNRRRGGTYGFDGISIKQNEESSNG